MSFKSLETLMIAEMKDVYDAEHQIADKLKKMKDAASDSELKLALQDHIERTQQHIDRLDQAFRELDEKPDRETCEGMKGILKEGEHMIKQAKDKDALDAALVASTQKAEHYEIASYGTLRTWANQSGRTELARLFEQTLQDEDAFDRRLTDVAMRLNREAIRA